MLLNIYRIPDAITVETDTESVQSAAFADVSVTFRAAENGWVPMLTADTTAVQHIFLRWNGTLPKDRKILGDAVERLYGHAEWRGIAPHRLMPWYFILSDNRSSVGYGVETQPNCFAYWMADTQGITLLLDVRCGGEGVLLRGRTIELTKIIQLENTDGENAFHFAQRFCKALCPSPLLPKAPVYGSNNWYYAYGKSSAEDILADTELVAELAQGLENRPYMVIDDCWQPLSLTIHAAGRPMEHGNERFPDMAKLAAEMRRRGVKPGIWIRPTRTHESMDILPQALRSDRNGEFLDLSEPQALSLVAEDVERVTGWGYELIKYDFATFDALGCWGVYDVNFLKDIQDGWRWHDTGKTNAEVMKNYYKTIYEHANGAVLIGCNVVGHLAAGCIHIHRSGNDTSGREWGHTEFMGVNTLAFRLPQNNAFFKIDADCVGVTRKVPWEYNRRFLDLVSKSGSPLFCSIAPDATTEQVKADIRRAYVINSVQTDTLEPLDWFQTTSPENYLHNGSEQLEYRWVPENGFTNFER